MNIRRIASEVYQAMWSRPQCTLPRARNMRQEDIDRIAKAIDDAVQEALNQPVLVSEWQEQQSELTQLREQNRVLASLLAKAQPHVCSMLCPSVKREGDPWTHKDLCTHITAALAATSQEGQHEL